MDGRDITEPAAEIFRHDSDKPHYRIFLYDPDRVTSFAAWFAAGAHDALRSPVSRGEVLSRVRTGARYLEFERRRQRRSSGSDVSDMYSRRGLVHRLRRMVAGDNLGLAQHRASGDLDRLVCGRASQKWRNGEAQLGEQGGTRIQRAVGEIAVSAYLGDGRFAMLLVGQSVLAARGIAESFANDFQNRDSLHDASPRPTLSCAVVPSH